ncbi:hypothetical protein HYD91_03865 [Mycoplasmopsis bovis]|nr:hypothetical protein [Mycoplasmopsis bovis]QQH35752.1 hypothetical protein HYD91_03865 [Mycoplasmopsis bovis]
MHKNKLEKDKNKSWIRLIQIKIAREKSETWLKLQERSQLNGSRSSSTIQAKNYRQKIRRLNMKYFIKRIKLIKATYQQLKNKIQ